MFETAIPVWIALCVVGVAVSFAWKSGQTYGRSSGMEAGFEFGKRFGAEIGMAGVFAKLEDEKIINVFRTDGKISGYEKYTEEETPENEEVKTT